MPSVLQILQEVGNTSSRKEKETILTSYKDNEELRLAFFYAYTPTLDYFISELVCESNNTISSSTRLSEVLNLIDINVCSRKITGHKARDFMIDQAAYLSDDDLVILKLIIGRDLRCGVGTSTINKIWPNLVYVHPYMRCSGLSEKLLQNFEMPCYSQEKLDGLYCDIVVTDDKVTYLSRAGNNLFLNTDDSDYALGLINDNDGDFVLQGEVLVLNEDKETLMPREESNGYINSHDRDMSRIVFVLWDRIPYEDFVRGECKIEYKHRFDHCKQIELELPYNFQLVDNRVCNTVQDIIDHFTDVRTNEGEGTVIKNINGNFWSSTTSKDQLKIKVIIEVDLKIVGFKPGKGKFEGKVGSILCQSSDGLLEVGVSGMNDKTRDYITTNIDSLINKEQIVTVKMNGVMYNKTGDGKHSAFLPRLKELRYDKSEADSFEQIVEQEKSFTDMLQLLDKQ